MIQIDVTNIIVRINILAFTDIFQTICTKLGIGDTLPVL